MNTPAPDTGPPGPGAPNTFFHPANYRPEESVTYLMRQILTAIAQEIERELAPADLTNAQWIPLFKLSLGHTSTAAELARACHLDAGAMTRMLDRLETKGLCQRERSASDRRVVHIALTEAGTAAAQGIPPILCELQNNYLQGFTPEEFATLKQFLRRILDNTHTWDGAAPPPLNSSSKP